MSYLDSNMPSKTFYASIDSEILCIVRTTIDLINMVELVNLLLVKMKKQGSECTLIISSLKKIFGKHFNVFHTFTDTTDKFNKLSSF